MKRLLSIGLVFVFLLSLASVSFGKEIAGWNVVPLVKVLPYAQVGSGSSLYYFADVQGIPGVYNAGGYLKGVTDIFQGTFVNDSTKNKYEFLIESNTTVNVHLQYFPSWGAFGNPALEVPTFLEIRRDNEPVGFAGYDVDLSGRPVTFIHTREMGKKPYLIDGAIKLESVSQIAASEDYPYAGNLVITISK